MHRAPQSAEPTHESFPTGIRMKLYVRLFGSPGSGRRRGSCLGFLRGTRRRHYEGWTFADYASTLGRGQRRSRRARQCDARALPHGFPSARQLQGGPPGHDGGGPGSQGGPVGHGCGCSASTLPQRESARSAAARKDMRRGMRFSFLQHGH
jgi:hypothetical protein